MADPSRMHALEIIQEVVRRRRTLDQAISTHPAFGRMPGADQAFARRLATTTIRRLGQIDDAISHCLDRPLPAKAHAATDTLRLGAAQILFMEIPDHAAVDTSVRLFKAKGAGGFAKLVNAVLRRLTREGQRLLEAQDVARLNTPDWLWTSWIEAYGDEICRKIAEAHLTEPPVDLTVKENPTDWASRLGGEVMPGGSVRLRDAGPVTAIDGYDAGEWWVQDMAAHLVTGLLGDVRGKSVIDLCAAPGGKTAALAAAGAHVTAVDRSAARLKRLRENLGRLNLSAEVIEADAETWRPDSPADAILLDAPCSATGTLRRHPDVARGKGPEDVAKLAALQRRLLNAAAEMIKPGGNLLFVTCSLQREEGPAVISEALTKADHWVHQEFDSTLFGDLADVIAPQGWFRSFPFHGNAIGGMDGFFACLLERLE